MANDTENKVDWQSIDPLHMTDEARGYWDAMVEAREMLEQTMSDAAALPRGRKLIFAYKRGFAVAIVEDNSRTAPKKSSTLAAFLEKAKANGYST